MNSLRARGVMSIQASRALGLVINVSRKSPGSLCTTPPGTRALFIQRQYWNQENSATLRVSKIARISSPGALIYRVRV